MKTRYRFPSITLALACALIATAPAAFSATSTKAVIDVDFESGLPPTFAKDKISVSNDTARAHSGRASLKIAPQKKGEWGTLTSQLDGKLDFASNHEISIWVYTDAATTRVSAYISADDGSGEPYTVVNAVGAIEPGKWCRLSGVVFADDWRKKDRDFKLIVRTTRGACWIDDLALTSGLPETPEQVWLKLEPALHTAADKRVSTLKPGDTLTLDARNAAFAPDTGLTQTSLPATTTAAIPTEGMLVFSIDAAEDLNLTGTLQLEADADLRPGIRATILCDDTVIAAPGVKAAAWKATPGVGNRPGPTAVIRGERPPATVTLNNWRMTKGRHYIAIAGTHLRPAGTFSKLELRAAARAAEKPLYTFAFFSDTHLGFGRLTKGHCKINARTGEQLETTLRQLKDEGSAFAILGGDMTDNGRRSMFEELAGVVKRAGLPVYGCIGNHDTFRDSRADIAATLQPLFPDGADKTDYAFSRPPLRFVVLDGSYWRNKDTPIQGFRAAGRAEEMTYREGMLDWLRDTLAKDTTTPTIVISHYQFYLRRGVSSVTGYNLGKTSMDKNLMTVIDAAPNVVATMNGHHHYNMVSTYHGITTLQNPAFATWPNGYRVCRVYSDRIEWEIRQMPNRGLIRESANPQMALIWPLSAYEDDIAGIINLAPRTK